MHRRAQPFLILALVLIASAALAQPYPSRPLRFVVGFTPGGGVDINARLLAAKMGELLGQQVVVENKPGAGTNIANELVAKSPADGYTLLFTSPAVAINMSLYRAPPYDALRDFAGVAIFSESTNLLVVPASLPAAYPGFAFARGFVHAVAGERMKGRFADVRAYVAGPPPMVDASLRLLLREARLPPADIRYDKFS